MGLSKSQCAYERAVASYGSLKLPHTDVAGLFPKATPAPPCLPVLSCSNYLD